MRNLFKFLAYGMLAASCLSLPVVGGTANRKEAQYRVDAAFFNEHEVEFLCFVQTANKKGILESIQAAGRHFGSKALIRAFDISCALYDKNPELSDFLLYTIFTQPVFVCNKEIFNELCVYFLPHLKDFNCYNCLSPVFFHNVLAKETSYNIISELIHLSSAGKHFVVQVLKFPKSDTDLYQKSSLLLEVLRVFLHAPRHHKIDLMCHVILYGCIVYGYLCKVGKEKPDYYLSLQCNALKSACATKNHLIVEKTWKDVSDFDTQGTSHLYLPLLFEVADYSLMQDVSLQKKFLKICLDYQAYAAFDGLVELGINRILAAQELQSKVLYQEKLAQNLNSNVMLLDLFIKYYTDNNFEKAITYCFKDDNAEFLRLMQRYLNTSSQFFQMSDYINDITVTADLVRNRSKHLKSYLKDISFVSTINIVMNIPHVLGEESYAEIASTVPISNCSLKLFENPAYSLYRSLMHYKKVCAAFCKRKFYMQACNNQLTDVIIESNKH